MDERQWHQAEAEIEREDQLETEQAFTEPSAVGATVLSAKTRKSRRAEPASSDVMTVEALAMRTGITGDQAQDLIDRLGNDRERSRKQPGAWRPVNRISANRKPPEVGFLS